MQISQTNGYKIHSFHNNRLGIDGSFQIPNFNDESGSVSISNTSKQNLKSDADESIVHFDQLDLVLCNFDGWPMWPVVITDKEITANSCVYNK